VSRPPLSGPGLWDTMDVPEVVQFNRVASGLG
jgi:hypothetical protein